jgi:hypothetical protein
MTDKLRYRSFSTALVVVFKVGTVRVRGTSEAWRVCKEGARIVMSDDARSAMVMTMTRGIFVRRLGRVRTISDGSATSSSISATRKMSDRSRGKIRESTNR